MPSSPCEKTTVVHLREPYDVLIDRTTPWGNPFTHKGSSLARFKVESRAEAIEAFRTWVLFSDDPEAAWIREHVHELQGKRLACWCEPLACHGRVLASMADGEELYSQEPLFNERM